MQLLVQLSRLTNYRKWHCHSSFFFFFLLSRLAKHPLGISMPGYAITEVKPAHVAHLFFFLSVSLMGLKGCLCVYRDIVGLRTIGPLKHYSYGIRILSQMFCQSLLHVTVLKRFTALYLLRLYHCQRSLPAR